MRIKLNKYHTHKPQKKDIIWAFVKILIVLVAMTAVFVGVNLWEKETYQVDSYKQQTEKTENETKTLEVDGTIWEHKEHIETYLFLGIDTKGQAVGVEGYYGGGQADVQMLMVVDHENKTWQVLQLNRDTMAEVPVLGMQGDVIGTEYQQIALSYSYGDGKKGSCENSVRTVSNLLLEENIDGYYALNMDGIIIINDMLGGVPVTITSDFSKVDESLTLGETMNLQGEQALTFLRMRKDVDDQTNVSRMARQRQYLNALGKKMGEQKEDDVLKIYDALFDYSVTNMGSKTMTELLEYANNYEQLEILTIDGEQVVEGENWAYYLDKEALHKVIVQMFYKPQ